MSKIYKLIKKIAATARKVFVCIHEQKNLLLAVMLEGNFHIRCIQNKEVFCPFYTVTQF